MCIKNPKFLNFNLPAFMGVAGAIALCLALMSPAAWAAPIYDLDILIGSANLPNSGDATELAGLAAILGVDPADLVMDLKVDTPNGFPAQSNGVSDQWYIDVDPLEPGFFLLKFGTGSTAVTDHTYYFANVDDMTKLVWSNEQVNFLTGGDCGANNQNACNIERLSHYALFNGADGGGQNPENPVPEPASFILMGIGLAALFGSCRKQAVVN